MLVDNKWCIITNNTCTETISENSWRLIVSEANDRKLVAKCKDHFCRLSWTQSVRLLLKAAQDAGKFPGKRWAPAGNLTIWFQFELQNKREVLNKTSNHILFIKTCTRPDNYYCFRPGIFFHHTGNIWTWHHSQEKKNNTTKTQNRARKSEADHQQLFFKRV